MSQPTVVFDGVWKKFRRGERHESLRDLIPSAMKTLVRRRRVDELDCQEFWALKDVSFSMEAGEALGIIGANGAGKSTALKLLTKILRPNRGRCAVRGRVGAMIEVAAGFHPDLTGRENIYLQGAIMGMKRVEIARKLDEIIDFAGINDFIDTPVKRYSSGMNARLGFSIAAHLEPAVLIIDEVLSVGDTAFQQKCMLRMQDFRANGVTIVFVSHNLEAVSRLCTSALLLASGQSDGVGPVDEVLEAYVRASRPTEPLDGHAEVELVDGALRIPDGGSDRFVAPGAPLALRLECVVRQAISDVLIVFQVFRSTDRLLVYDAHINGSDVGLEALSAGERVVLDLQFRARLTRGHYQVDALIFHGPTERFLTRLSTPSWFTIGETRTHGGVADLEVTPRVLARSQPLLDETLSVTA